MRVISFGLCFLLAACALGTAVVNKEHLTPCQLAQAAYSDAQDGVAIALIVGRGQDAAAKALGIASLAVQRQCGTPGDNTTGAPVL